MVCGQDTLGLTQMNLRCFESKLIFNGLKQKTRLKVRFFPEIISQMGIPPQTERGLISKIRVPVGSPTATSILNPMKNKAHKRSVKQKLSVLAFIALYLLTPFFTNATIQSAFATESVPVPLSTTTGNELDENALLSPGAAKTQSTVPSSPYEHPTMSLIEQETRSRNSSAAQQVNRDLNNDFANYNETYSGLNQFWNDTIVGKFFNNFLPWIGKNVSEFLYSWIPSAVQYLARALEIFVLNPNIAVNGLANDPRFTISNTPAAQEGQTYINAIAPEVRKLADIMYGIAVDLLLLLFVLCIWKYWADASWGRGGSNLMGAVGRLITTSALMLAWPTIYAFWIQISNEMIKAIYFNSAAEMVSFDQAMATVIKAGLWAVGGLLLNALAPVAGAALGGLAGGPLGGLVGGTIGGFVAFAGLIIFMVFGAILIAQLVYLVTLKSIQTILLTAQYMFAPIFIVMFATPDTENACAGFVRSFVEVSLWSFVWVGFLRLLVVIMNTDFSPWGKVVLGLGILQLMISVPAFIARAQISPMSDFLSAGMITGGLVKGAAAIGNTANTFAGYWADKKMGNHTLGAAQGSPKTATSDLNPSKDIRNGKESLWKQMGKDKDGNPIKPGDGPPATDPTGKTPKVADEGDKDKTTTGDKAGGEKAAVVPPTKTETGSPDASAKAATKTGAEKGKTPETGKSGTPTGGAADPAKKGSTTPTGTPTSAAPGAKTGGTPVLGDASGASGEEPSLLEKNLAAATTPTDKDPLGGMLYGTESDDPKKRVPMLGSFAPWAAGRSLLEKARLIGMLNRLNKGGKEGKEGTTLAGGSIGTGTTMTAIGADKDGNFDKIAAAKVLNAGGIAELAKAHEPLYDAARQSAIDAGYDKPQGMSERIASGIAMGLNGKHWANSATAKNRFHHGMYKEAMKGSLAYMEGKQGNAYTSALRDFCGDFTPDHEQEAVLAVLDPTSANSGFKANAVKAREACIRTGTDLGMPTITGMSAVMNAGMPQSMQKIGALSNGRYIESMVNYICETDPNYANATYSDRNLMASRISDSLSKQQVEGITAIGAKHGIDACGDIHRVAATIQNVSKHIGTGARSGDFENVYAGMGNLDSYVASPETVVVDTNDHLDGRMHSKLGLDHGAAENVKIDNLSGGSKSLMDKILGSGVNPKVAANPRVMQVATQVDFDKPGQSVAFANAANALGNNIDLQRVFVVRNMMASDPRGFESGRISANDVYIAEAVAHIQAESGDEKYASTWTDGKPPEYCKDSAYLHSRIIDQVADMQQYSPSSSIYDEDHSPHDHAGDTAGRTIREYHSEVRRRVYGYDPSRGRTGPKRTGPGTPGSPVDGDGSDMDIRRAMDEKDAE